MIYFILLSTAFKMSYVERKINFFNYRLNFLSSRCGFSGLPVPPSPQFLLISYLPRTSVVFSGFGSVLYLKDCTAEGNMAVDFLH